MLITLKDEQGNLKAVCEYYIVDENGNFNKEGKFVWINEVEISKSYRNNGCIKSLIKETLSKVPEQCEFGYFWRRRKYPNRKVRMWHRKKWEKLIKMEVTNV